MYLETDASEDLSAKGKFVECSFLKRASLLA